MIVIKEVKNAKEKKEFIDFPLKMYKGNKCFVPPLYGDEKKIFSKKYVYYDTCKAVYFNAYQDNKIVGRISGILQMAYNKKANDKRIRFTRFDAIDNQEVANALFEAVENWGKELGMDTVCGPLGFSDLEREGLLIEGFDQMSTFEEQYNYSYYQKLIENCGYQKEVDWEERQLRLPASYDDKIERLANVMMRRYKLHFGLKKNIHVFLKTYADQFFAILDKTYANLYGTVPFTPGTKKMILNNFKLLIDVKHVAVILNEKEEVVCFGACMPSIAEDVQKSGGHLTLSAILRILKTRKHPKVLDLALVGVVEGYEGTSCIILDQLYKMLQNAGVEHIETNLNLEENKSVISLWNNFDAVLNKKRRSFIKKI